VSERWEGKGEESFEKLHEQKGGGGKVGKSEMNASIIIR
jgi:hypothetical protein